MSTKRIEEWLQIIGLFGVIGSLIFVGLQLKQDRDIALSEIWQSRTGVLIQNTSSAASSEILMSAFAKSEHGRLAELTPVEEEASRWFVWGTMYMWENSHYQFTLGFMPQEHWLRVRGGIKVELQHPLRGPLMREISTRMRPSFRAVVDEIILELIAEKA